MTAVGSTEHSAEANYWAQLEHSSVPRIGRNAGLLVLLILAIATLGDLSVVPEDHRVRGLLARAGGVAWTLGHTALAHFRPDLYRVHYRWVLVAFMWIVGVMCAALGCWADAIESVYVLGLVQAQFGYATFIPLRRSDMAYGTVGSSLLFLLTPGLLGHPLSSSRVFTLVTVLVIFATLALYAHRQLLSARVTEFHQAQQLVSARNDLERRVTERTQELSTTLALLERSEAAARDLARSLVQAREAEGSRIGRELHDELGQLLTGLRIGASVLGRKLRREGNDGGADEATRLADIADDAVQSVRSVARELRPTMLDDLGLVASLEALVQLFGGRTGLSATLDATLDEALLDADQRTVLYRVVQEALTNAARHANANAVIVTVRHDAAAVHLSVDDDGVGIAPEALKRTGGFGLRGMLDRALSVGATLHVARLGTTGTRVHVVLPLGASP